MMEKSCKQTLGDKIQEDLLRMDTRYECGSIIFYLMMRRNRSSSEDIVLAMTKHIKSMKLSYFQGKDVIEVTG